MNFLHKIAATAGLLTLAFGAAHAQNKELVVGSSATYRPFAYESPTKEIVGYDVDMIKAIAQKAGLQIKIVNTPWTGIFAALNNGDVDLVISGVTINDKRKQSYDFTTPYFEARQLMMSAMIDDHQDAVSDLEVFIENPDRVRSIGRQIAAALGGRVQAVDWQQANSTLVNAVEIERNVMFLILALIILVASFNIISGMIMLVKDKGRDIAILRTMGASRGMILRIFMLSGASIGIVGTLTGFALGVVFTLNIEAIRQFLQDLLQVKLFAAEIYFFTRIPAQIEPGEVAAIVAMALVLSFLATLYPSWRAARLDPVEGLRYE